MQKKAKTQIIIIFVCRIILWVIALASTVYWIRYSFQLTMNEIYEPEEYAPLLRPVLYVCVGIAVASIGLSFGLYAIAKRIKKNNDIH